MRKKALNISIIVLYFITIALESIPYGSVVYFNVVTEEGTGKQVPSYYAYFDPSVMKFAVILPFVIGILTVILAIAYIIIFFMKKEEYERVCFLFTCLLVIFSLVHIIYSVVNINRFTIISLFVLLFQIAICIIFYIKQRVREMVPLE